MRGRTKHYMDLKKIIFMNIMKTFLLKPSTTRNMKTMKRADNSVIVEKLPPNL